MLNFERKFSVYSSDKAGLGFKTVRSSLTWFMAGHVVDLIDRPLFTFATARCIFTFFQCENIYF